MSQGDLPHLPVQFTLDARPSGVHPRSMSKKCSHVARQEQQFCNRNRFMMAADRTRIGRCRRFRSVTRLEVPHVSPHQGAGFAAPLPVVTPMVACDGEPGAWGFGRGGFRATSPGGPPGGALAGEPRAGGWGRGVWGRGIWVAGGWGGARRCSRTRTCGGRGPVRRGGCRGPGRGGRWLPRALRRPRFG